MNQRMYVLQVTIPYVDAILKPDSNSTNYIYNQLMLHLHQPRSTYTSRWSTYTSRWSSCTSRWYSTPADDLLTPADDLLTPADDLLTPAQIHLHQPMIYLHQPIIYYTNRWSTTQADDLLTPADDLLTPADDQADDNELVPGYEGVHHQRVQTEPLTEHPGEVADHCVLREHVQGLTPHL